jgi:hypothetical protein
MKDSELKTEVSKTMAEVATALFELRDALAELSLSLKDWQFEHDLERRKKTENTVRQVLRKIMSAPDLSS